MRQLPAMRYPLVPRAAFYPEGGVAMNAAAAGVASTSRKRVALVIGAGSVKCAAALGLWKVLKREGIALDLLVGCSGGSIYAGLMALGHDVDTCERMTRELWTPAITRKRDLRSVFSAFFPRLFGFNGR